MRRKLCQLGPDFVERETDSLRKHDERNPPQDGSWISSLPAAAALRGDQPAVFIEAER